MAENWSQILNLSEYDRVNAVGTTVDGSVYAVGSVLSDIVSSDSFSSHDAFIAKFGKDGILEWSKTLGTDRLDAFTNLATDEQGSAYVAGYSSGSIDDHAGYGITVALVVKYDKEGNRLWTSVIGTNATDKTSSIRVTEGGNLLIGGTTYGNFESANSNYLPGYFVASYDLQGNHLWSRVLDWESRHSPVALAIASDGSTYAIGTEQIPDDAMVGSTSSTLIKSYIYKYDKNGSREWFRSISLPSDHHP